MCGKVGARQASGHAPSAGGSAADGVVVSSPSAGGAAADGDVVVGETWLRIQHLGMHAYFDRVASKANPADGLSRGRFDGPWKQVLRGHLPSNLTEILEADATTNSEEVVGDVGDDREPEVSDERRSLEGDTLHAH